MIRLRHVDPAYQLAPPSLLSKQAFSSTRTNTFPLDDSWSSTILEMNMNNIRNDHN